MGQLGRFRQPTGILTSHLDGDHLYLDEDNLYLGEDTTDDDLVFARLDNDDKEEGSAGQPEAPSILTSHLPGHAHQQHRLHHHHQRHHHQQLCHHIDCSAGEVIN